MVVTVLAARMGASSAQQPNREVCAARMVFSGPIATSSAPTAAMPVGPENSVSAPMMIAIATGSSRLVATPRSTEHQVSRMPSAMIGSGRSPLFSGSQNARNMPAAVHAAAAAGLDGVAESRDHLAADHPPAGQRHQQRGQPHPDAVGADVRPQRQQVVVPAERRLGRAEPSVVVGHVAGVLGHPGHRQDVAVVGRVGADEVPPHQDSGHQAVQRRHRPPARRQEPLMPHAVGGVEHVQRAERDDRHHDADDHRQQLQQSRRAAVAGVDGRRELRPGGAGPDRSVNTPTICGRKS